MADNKFMGTFDNETEVLRKIEELKEQGSTEDDMYVMARDKDQLSMVRGRTDVDYKSSEGSWMDKFMGFLSGNEPVREAFSSMGVDEEEADRYYKEVQNGKILLFVDREFGASYEGKAPYDNTAYGDPESGAAGAGGVAAAPGTPGSGEYVDNSAVAKDGLTVDTNNENDIAYNTRPDIVDTGETASASRFDRRDTAGVGDETGTGFGLGTEDKVKDVPNANQTEEEKLRLHEERLNVDKERVQTGEVNVGKHVVEEEQSVEVPVEREEVYVERRPVNEETAGDSNETYQEGDDIHIPVTEERVDVSKTDVVNEEIVVGKRKVQDTETVSDTVRREEADIEETSDDDRLNRDKKDRF